MKIFVLLIFMSNVVTACANLSNPSISDLPAATYLNVSYGADPKQLLDVHLPAQRTAAVTKVMFLIHGGGWSGGDKSEFYAYIDSLKKHLPGFAFINVNYRLANFSNNKFPAQEIDVKAAIGFVMDKQEEYNISRKVVLLGTSAGAHLALLQGYKNTEPVQAQAVISFFGPTDIVDIYKNPPNPQVPFLLQILMGGTPAEKPDNYLQASPVHFVTPQTCPTLLFQGGRDALVNPRQANLLKDKLQKAGVPNELIIYPHEGHGWRGMNLGDSFTKLKRFLEEHVN
ncbi:MAG: alpha/beta hydrolase [Chitinophagaceae bacterium]